MEVIIWNSHFIVKPGFRGRCVVELKDLQPNKQITAWYQLGAKHGETHQDKIDKAYGEISLTLYYNKEG